MRVLVCGGRDFTDREFIYKWLNKFHKVYAFDVLIEGNARGVDRISGYWARQKKITNLKFPADWSTHGKRAGPIRNQQMLDEGRPDLAIIFPGGRGTADMRARVEEAGVDYIALNKDGMAA